MTEPAGAGPRGLRGLPRNVWAASLCSLLMDISSEMVLNLLPLYLSNALHVGTAAIGLLEGVAESAASLLKVFSGWFSDRLGNRKWLAVAGYALSAVVRPLFYFAESLSTVAVARWTDRVGKGVRTAPRDALLADSVPPEQRGLVFGFHRAADSAGAVLGLGGALLVVWLTQGGTSRLEASTFRLVALVSILPALLAVAVLAGGAREPARASGEASSPVRLTLVSRDFGRFLLMVGLFQLGNSADAFLVLRGQERGLSVLGVLGMLMTFNLIYSLVSTAGGALSDRVGRRSVIIAGWLTYALLYLGFALARSGWQVGAAYALYGVYYGLAYGTERALVADLVPAAQRGTAYGTYNAVVGFATLPASLLAGVLWQGVGPAAPFYCGAALALVAALLLAAWRPVPRPQ